MTIFAYRVILSDNFWSDFWFTVEMSPNTCWTCCWSLFNLTLVDSASGALGLIPRPEKQRSTECSSRSSRRSNLISGDASRRALMASGRSASCSPRLQVSTCLTVWLLNLKHVFYLNFFICFVFLFLLTGHILLRAFTASLTSLFSTAAAPCWVVKRHKFSGLCLVVILTPEWEVGVSPVFPKRWRNVRLILLAFTV